MEQAHDATPNLCWGYGRLKVAATVAGIGAGQSADAIVAALEAQQWQEVRATRQRQLSRTVDKKDAHIEALTEQLRAAELKIKEHEGAAALSTAPPTTEPEPAAEDESCSEEETAASDEGDDPDAPLFFLTGNGPIGRYASTVPR